MIDSDKHIIIKFQEKEPIEQLIDVFIEKYELLDAPDHLQESLRKVLKNFSGPALFSLVFEDSNFKKLFKMFKIIEAVKEAQESGAYEQAEHLTSQIDLETGEEKNEV